MVGPFLPDADKLAALRALLPATGAGIYLATAEAGPLPAETARAMADAADWELRTGRAHGAHREEMAARVGEARAAMAAILRADLDTVSIAHSAADGLAAVVAAVRPRRILLSEACAPAVTARIASVAAALGATLAVAGAIPPIPAGTDLVVVPHVTGDGRVLPVEAAARSEGPTGPAVVVDGSLAVGAIPVDVSALGVTAYATDAHRWLLGPAGTAAVHVRPPLGGVVRETLETSQFHGPSVVGMARSAGWIAMYIGLDWLTGRTAALARRLADLLAGVDGVEVLTPHPPGAGIVAFRLRRWPDADEAGAELGRRVFAMLSRPDGDTLVASLGAWNTDEELSRFAEAVALLAGHSPETLPRRPALTILHEPAR